MTLLKYDHGAIVLKNVESIAKTKKSREYFKDNKDRYILCFGLSSGKEQEICYDNEEERDKDYDEALSLLASL